MAPFFHGAVIADILQPFISERNEWMLRHHPAFQQYHFLQHPSADRHAREAFRGSPHFDYTARYCELYDQNSFDPDFPTLPLEHFEPIVAAFFSRFDGIELPPASRIARKGKSPCPISMRAWASARSSMPMAPMTRFGGGIMAPEVAEAMRAATQHCVDIPELQASGSRIIAEITGAEAGCVTSGASAAACSAARPPA